MFGYQFFDAVLLVQGFASNLLNLCNLRNLRIFNLRDLGFVAARSTPAHADGPAPTC